MNISLTPTLDEYVKEQVASGLYNNASEVMQEALHLLREKKLKAQQLSDALDKGYDAYLEGRHGDTTAKAILDKVIAKRDK